MYQLNVRTVLSVKPAVINTVKTTVVTTVKTMALRRLPLVRPRRGAVVVGARLLSGDSGNCLSDSDSPDAAPVLPAESYITWDASKPVRLRTGTDFPQNR